MKIVRVKLDGGLEKVLASRDPEGLLREIMEAINAIGIRGLRAQTQTLNLPSGFIVLSKIISADIEEVD